MRNNVQIICTFVGRFKVTKRQEQLTSAPATLFNEDSSTESSLDPEHKLPLVQTNSPVGAADGPASATNATTQDNFTLLGGLGNLAISSAVMAAPLDPMYSTNTYWHAPALIKESAFWKSPFGKSF